MIKGPARTRNGHPIPLALVSRTCEIFDHIPRAHDGIGNEIENLALIAKAGAPEVRASQLKSSSM
jgi:hypothetical protein